MKAIKDFYLIMHCYLLYLKFYRDESKLTNFWLCFHEHSKFRQQRTITTLLQNVI